VKIIGCDPCRQQTRHISDPRKARANPDSIVQGQVGAVAVHELFWSWPFCYDEGKNPEPGTERTMHGQAVHGHDTAGDP